MSAPPEMPEITDKMITAKAFLDLFRMNFIRFTFHSALNGAEDCMVYLFSEII